jgi:hypothetical protein
VTDEVSTIAHEVGDVLAITYEVFAVGGRAFTIAAPVEHQQAKALIGERPLRLPLLRPGRQRAVNEHHRRTRAPSVYEELCRHQALAGLRKGGGCVPSRSVKPYSRASLSEF